ncbi:MAG TPA: TIGR03000 domain-containing protein [Gemmataceae bacterium]|nr:TIGR03000 domain-containing protein [Gemmataceae bacterium]
MRRAALAALAVGLVLLVAAESAQAQRFYGRGGFAVRTPWFSFGYGTPAYYYGWGSPYYGGWYGTPGYGRWYSSYYYPGYTYGWYSRPYYSRWYYSYGYPYYYSSGFSPSYSSGFYGSTYYTYPSTASYAGLERPSGTTQSFYAGPGPGNDQVLVRVTVPEANARVWIDDHPTQQGGFERVFISPPLPSGRSYSYQIRAAWTQNGQEIIREKQVTFQPGETVTVNFAESGEDRRPGAAGPLRSPPLREVDTAPARTDGAFEGRIMRVADGEVVLTDRDGGNPRTFRLAEGGQVLIDGRRADLSGLQPGMRVVVTPQAGATGVAIRLEVNTTPDRTPPPGRPPQ